MLLSEFYKYVVKFGVMHDPRENKSAIKSFPDSAILYGKPSTRIKNILIGVDIEVGEILLAERIRSKQGLDLVISHHPEGQAYAHFYEVMRLQVDILSRAGVKFNAARSYLDERMREVSRKVMPQNHMRPVDAARILDIPFMCMHTPADNHAYSFLKKLLSEKKPNKIVDLIGILNEIPEYKFAEKELNLGPRLILGNLKRPAGKIMLEMTGGTEGPKEIYGKLRDNGVRTLVCMHLSDEHLKKVKDANLNVVIAGHISSDNLGLNLLLDNIEKKAGEEFNTINCSGFRRFRRI
ncbi:MAG: NGG1p interacting factor NIF3 [Candidatus Omnitrophota bacterium]|nr:NGG1p interacting factor NIF3 [Candidatus Omnitrophota bacterium]MBU1928777.1 NGG1p interacting factor NIF3 [Candidatus Omnitrophota bacterium]MBU2034232.1 NGG1p interacting factor NIF3 [Candidatus Omnitrophota bacterium]MBU2258273.1 NGG1p interacting factor NIF3 [Candidatus Omnitrophota bacterium]